MTTGVSAAGGQFRILADVPASGSFAQWVAVPSTATSAGSPGQIAADANFFYVCIATNTWVRAGVLTF